jgi:adenosylmethionine-8-amino-7-oxononanoate aminotransferase
MRAICDRHGVLMIADEVMCGAGRTGSWRALAEDGVVPDLMAVAKGLAGGYLPLGACVFTARVGEALDAAHGGPLTGHTFTGHTACCAAGVAVQRIIARDDLLGNVRRLAPRLRALLAEATAGIAEVGDIRGRGFFQGVELVADPETKRPFAAAHRLYLKIREETFARGLICYPSGGGVDGVNGDAVIFAPPYIATEADLAEIAGRFGEALRAALKRVRG